MLLVNVLNLKFQRKVRTLKNTIYLLIFSNTEKRIVQVIFIYKSNKNFKRVIDKYFDYLQTSNQNRKVLTDFQQSCRGGQYVQMTRFSSTRLLLLFKL